MNWPEHRHDGMCDNHMPSDATTCLILDVRSPGEYEMGHVEGALLLPLSDLMEGRMPPVENKAAPIVVYCASGGRSSMAQALLAQMGYSRVSNGGSPQEVATALGKPLVART